MYVIPISRVIRSIRRSTEQAPKLPDCVRQRAAYSSSGLFGGRFFCELAADRSCEALLIVIVFDKKILDLHGKFLISFQQTNLLEDRKKS